ncbi:methyltransferase type 12 [Hyaloraphidium curvatum]|nr:methyltransferase type 12 [Hyaloraphidium curvatum]
MSKQLVPANSFTEARYTPPKAGTPTNKADVRPFFQYFNMLQTHTTMMAVAAVLDRVGVFRAMRHKGPVSCEEIATETGLQVRYLKESLAAMAASGFVLYHPHPDPQSLDLGKFELPEEHALILCDNYEAQETPHPLFFAGQLENLAAYWSVVPGVAKAFKEGGGVAFKDFGPEVVRGMARTHAGQHALLVRKWLPAVPGLVAQLEKGIRVLDVGCGAGSADVLMAKAFPNSQFVCVDLDQLSIEHAKANAEKAGVLGKNMHPEVRSVYDLGERDAYDVIMTLDVVHDLPDPLRGLKEIMAALKPTGLYIMVEPRCSNRLEENIGSAGQFLYSVSCMHCMTQSLAQGGLGLGAAWGPARAEKFCRDAGATSFEEFPVPNPGNAFYGVRKGSGRL